MNQSLHSTGVGSNVVAVDLSPPFPQRLHLCLVGKGDGRKANWFSMPPSMAFIILRHCSTQVTMELSFVPIATCPRSGDSVTCDLGLTGLWGCPNP